MNSTPSRCPGGVAVHFELPFTMLRRPPLPLGEALGLHPFHERYKQALLALKGDRHVPPTRFGLSSLKQFFPSIATRLWQGRAVVPRRAIITNLFNHRQTPIEDGWSVRVTQVEDFRGGSLTYDSHNGTDLALPIGTTLVAPAAARVVRVATEFHRGGLKIFLDHGENLMSTYAHLARALVEPGQRLERGEPFALTGYSGLDGLVTFPIGVPHTHMNVWFNGEPVDPFPHHNEPSLFRGGDDPRGAKRETGLAPESVYSASKVQEAIAACRSDEVRHRLHAVRPLWQRAGHLLAEMNYYPTRFTAKPDLYEREYPRRERLDLPLRADDFDGLVFADALPAGAVRSLLGRLSLSGAKASR